jgi:hypothetical protein
LRRNPGFTAVAVLTLALGIGANTAIFSLINTLMLGLLPVRDPGRLVELLDQYPAPPVNGFSLQAYQQMRDHNHVFSGLIVASDTSRFYVRGEGLEAERVDGEYVSGNYFRVLGVKPAIGRLAQTADLCSLRSPSADRQPYSPDDDESKIANSKESDPTALYAACHPERSAGSPL